MLACVMDSAVRGYIVFTCTESLRNTFV